VEQLSTEEIKAFKKLADICTESKWIYTSAESGVNIHKAVHMIIELV